MIQHIVVFCGASEGYIPVYIETAYQMGAAIANRQCSIIYGGAKLGLMGAVADGALQNGGKVTGIIPQFLQDKEIVHDTISETIVVETMHDRKLKMYERCDGIIALPGGWGTLDELFEMMTWAQLGLHQKPIGILNCNGFYEPFMAMLNNMVLEGFVKESYMNMLIVSDDIEDLLDKMMKYQPIEFLPPTMNTQHL